MVCTTARTIAKPSSIAAWFPNIDPNPRGRKHPKRGRKPLFDPAIFEERFHTIERLFAWEDTH